MCAVDLGRIVNLYEQAASDDGEIMRPKEPNWTLHRPMTMHNADAGWQKPQTNLRNVWSGTARSILGKNIMSPSKLREKWDELVIRLGRSPVQRCVNHF